MKEQNGLIKKITVTVVPNGDNAIITKEIVGFNTLELVGLYTELLEEIKRNIIAKQIREKNESAIF
jgi:hypothetical protein